MKTCFFLTGSSRPIRTGDASLPVAIFPIASIAASLSIVAVGLDRLQKVRQSLSAEVSGPSITENLTHCSSSDKAPSRCGQAEGSEACQGRLQQMP